MPSISSAPFECAGWSVIPSFLGASDLAALAAAVDAVLAGPRHPGMSRPGNDLVPLRWNDAIVARILGSEGRIQQLHDLLHASDLKWISAYVSSKAPYSPALWWHQDWWCWDHPTSFRRPPAQVAVLCYLNHTSATNGALRVLPGSHHRSMPIHAALPEPHGDHANALPADHAALADCPDQITAMVDAGDAVVLDYRLLHGTHANGTPDRRDCILLSFTPGWRDLPADIKAHLMVHPALPDASEAAGPLPNGYRHLLPQFHGTPASLPVNRTPPPAFAAISGAV